MPGAWQQTRLHPARGREAEPSLAGVRKTLPCTSSCCCTSELAGDLTGGGTASVRLQGKLIWGEIPALQEECGQTLPTEAGTLSGLSAAGTQGSGSQFCSQVEKPTALQRSSCVQHLFPIPGCSHNEISGMHGRRKPFPELQSTTGAR